ncbi:MAG TPA: DUF5666 domain-containing protein [Burkholderiaceae bacterium]|nr:DUF5666 domain-containing protein [Burkholderiaceae bacterium]
MPRSIRSLASAATVALVLSACGGGGSSSPSSATLSGASPGATSSGTVTAFGSVFVNGHEFDTTNARVIDDDAGTTGSTSSLEVGMSVDVRASALSSDRTPAAAEIHVHPLVRGVVDGSDATAGTLTVMGQTVQLTASTVFSDHRACVDAASSPCNAIRGQSDLTVTSGSGSGAVGGSYVTVHGFLFAGDASSGGANVVATLISVADPSAARVAYKAEGVVKAVGSGGSITIGGLAVDLSAATCHAQGVVPCASAFSVGQVVSAFAAKAPALPATTFTADAAFLRGRIAVETPGATVEVEGKVSSITLSPASFVVRGITVDASALGGSLPAVGDLVVVTGTVADSGTKITASAVKVIHAARSATFAFEGDATAVAAGPSANTFVLTLLGQSMTVNASTRLLDLSQRRDPAADPFNIMTFQTHLAASASQHLIVRTQADAAGDLTATVVIIVPASTVSAVSGVIDATPAPINGSAGMSSTFTVHGLAISADPAAIVRVVPLHNAYGFGGMGRAASGTVAAGDMVLAFGTFASNTLSVTAPPSARSIVLDFGAGLRDKDRDGF